MDKLVDYCQIKAHDSQCRVVFSLHCKHGMLYSCMSLLSKEKLYEKKKIVYENNRDGIMIRVTLKRSILTSRV